MPYHFKKKPKMLGPDRYYHGTIRDVRTGVAAGGRRWWLYVVRPDYYWVEGNVIRDAPLIKWFSGEDLWKKIGEQVFLVGKFKEPSSIPPAADMLANVGILTEELFKARTGYPEGKREGGPEQKPEPGPLPSPPKPPEPAKTCAQKVEELIAKLDGILKNMQEVSDGVTAELDKVVPGGSKVLRGDLIPKAEEAIRVLESSASDVDAMNFVERNLPDIRAESEAPISPKEFLDMAKALMDHALAAIDLAAESPESETIDMGDVHANIGGKTVNLHPLFGPEDLSRGIDHIENVFLSPLQAEVSRAERENAQGIPEFQHDLPFIPKTLGKTVNRTEMTAVIKRELEKFRATLNLAREAVRKIPGFAEVEKLVKEYQQEVIRLEGMKWDCPGEVPKITAWNNAHPARPQPYVRASNWIGKNCKFAR